MKIARGVGMNTPLRYAILEHFTQMILLARPLAEAIHHKDRDLANQVRRALNSAGLNIAEAFGNSGGNARVRFQSARGSLYEAQAGFRLAIAWGYITQAESAPTLESLNDLGARVYGLSRT